MGFFDIGASHVLGMGAGIGGSLISGAQNKKRLQEQFERQKQLMGIQFANQQQLNVQGQQLGMDTWRQTSYPAQVQMMKEAGLNPALMYGGAGAGGSTSTPGGGSAGGGNAPQAMNSAMEIQAGMQMAKLASEVKVNESVADLNEANANKIGGVDTEEAQSRIQLNTQGVQNKKAEEALIRANTHLAKLQGQITEGSLEDQIDRYQWEARRAMEEADMANSAAYVSRATRDAQIGITLAQEKTSILASGLMTAQTSLTWEQARKTANDIFVANEMVKIGQQNANTNSKNAVTNQEAQYWTGRGQNIEMKKQDMEKELRNRGMDIQETKMILDAIFDFTSAMRY